MPVKKPDFVYVTYIATTPEEAWQALVDPTLMRQYWFGVKPGSTAHENISEYFTIYDPNHQKTIRQYVLGRFSAIQFGKIKYYYINRIKVIKDVIN